MKLDSGQMGLHLGFGVRIMSINISALRSRLRSSQQHIVRGHEPGAAVQLRRVQGAGQDAGLGGRPVCGLGGEQVDRRAEPRDERSGDAGAAEHAARDGAGGGVGQGGLQGLVADVAAQEAGDHVQVPVPHQGELGKLGSALRRWAQGLERHFPSSLSFSLEGQILKIRPYGLCVCVGPNYE